MSGNKRALMGNDSKGARFYTIYPDTKAFVRRLEASVCGEAGWGHEGRSSRSWVLIRRLAGDYRRFREIQSQGLSCCFSPLVTMPTVPGNY